jgi:hypothetical protein
MFRCGGEISWDGVPSACGPHSQIIGGGGSNVYGVGESLDVCPPAGETARRF